MRVAVFFVYLCFFLLRGNDLAHTGAHHYGSPGGKGRHAVSSGSGQQLAFVVEDGVGAEEELAADEAEEEDQTGFSAGKYRALASWFQALSYLFLLGYLYKRLKSLPVVYGRPSQKYLLQGVLRI